MKNKSLFKKAVSLVMICVIALGLSTLDASATTITQNFEGLVRANDVTLDGWSKHDNTVKYNIISDDSNVQGSSNALQIINTSSKDVWRKARYDFIQPSDMFEVAFRTKIMDLAQALVISFVKANSFANSDEPFRVSYQNASKNFVIGSGATTTIIPKDGAVKYTIASGDWVNIKVLIDSKNGKAAAWIGNRPQELKFFEYSKDGVKPTIQSIAFPINKADASGIIIDNLIISEQDASSKDTQNQEKVKIAPTDDNILSNRLANAIVMYINNPLAFVNNTKTSVDINDSKVMPIIKDGRTLVPVRFISESLGAKVEWDNAISTIRITMGNKTVKMVIDSVDIHINDKKITIDVPAQIQNGRTLIPLRALVEALGKKVFWDDRGLIIISDIENIFDKNSEKNFIDSIVNKFNASVTINFADKYYVSIKGNDSNNGTIESPFATIERARDVIREQKKQGKLTNPITVYIREGEYNINKAIEFTPDDSGTETASITYESYNGEQVVISGGKKISGFVERQDGLWVAQIPAVAAGKWYFEQLWVNTERATRARTPNKGNYYFMHTTVGNQTNPKMGKLEDLSYNGFIPSEENVMPALNKLLEKQLNDVLVHTYFKWSVGRQLIDYLIPEIGGILMSGKREQLNPQHYALSRGTRYYLENYFEALDEPGEWFLSREGELIYKPQPGETFENTEIYAPISEQLISINGIRENNSYVEYLSFKNLNFRHTSSITTVDGWGQRQSAPKLNGAIRMIMAKNIELSSCDIRNIAETAIVLDQGNYNITISKNYIYDMGGGGIRVGEDLYASKIIGENMKISNVTIDNNIIYKGGRIYNNASAILLTQVGNSKVSHNDIADFYYTGIGVGWNWNYGDTTTHNNIIEYNRIRGIGQGVLDDMGGIYTLGESNGTIIRNNIIRDVWRYKYGGHGIYNDQATHGVLVENNLVYNVEEAPYFCNWGRNNTFINNIFAYGNMAAISGGNSTGELKSTGSFFKNIILTDNGYMLHGGYQTENFNFDKNAYINLSGKKDGFTGLIFDEWQKKGKDAEGTYITKDPFVDSKNGNFKLKDNSVAERIGFVEFDYSKAGVYGEQEWIKKGSQLKVNPPIRVENKYLRKFSLNESFENSPLDSMMPFATVDVSKANTFKVSNGDAKTGKQSLKIIDTDDKNAKVYYPMMVFNPSYTNGIVTVEYDIKFNDDKFDFINNWQDREEPEGAYTIACFYRFKDKALYEAKDKLMDIPSNKWIHLKAMAKIGPDADGTYDLEVTIDKEKTKQFSGLKSPSLRLNNLNWLAFTSNAVANTTAYIDNLKIYHRLVGEGEPAEIHNLIN